MSPNPALKPTASVEAYLQGELETDVKHEYLAGEVVAMGGASRSHGLIATALALAIGPQARDKGCQLFIADMKVRIEHDDESYFYYPDLLVTCDRDDRERLYCTRPCLIIEILSPGTERIDRREKLLAYRLLPSLSEYILVDSERPLVETYRKTAEGWRHEVVTEGTFRVACVDASVTLEALYADVR